jgi:hypothetical protein
MASRNELHKIRVVNGIEHRGLPIRQAGFGEHAAQNPYQIKNFNSSNATDLRDDRNGLVAPRFFLLPPSSLGVIEPDALHDFAPRQFSISQNCIRNVIIFVAD